MEDEELSSLVLAAEQLASQLDDGSLGELPRVERNLRQIMEASNQLWIRTSQSGSQENQGYKPVFYTLKKEFSFHFVNLQSCSFGLSRFGSSTSCSQTRCT